MILSNLPILVQRKMSKKVSINNFASEITKITREYLDEVEEGANKAVMETAFDARDDLKVAGDFKNRTGRYRKGWTITFDQSRFAITAIVHDVAYQLTHLLENGHQLVRGGRVIGEVQAFPHIEEVNNEAQRMLEERIEKAI